LVSLVLPETKKIIVDATTWTSFSCNLSLLDSKNQIIAMKTVATATATGVTIAPREFAVEDLLLLP